MLHTAPPQVPDHELLKLIGRGSYGEVWLARNVMGTCRAIKIVHRDAFEHDRPYEREYEGIRKFEPISRGHDSQVDVLHVGRDAGSFYYVMELADDAAATASPGEPLNVEHYSPRTLRSELNRRGLLPIEECVEIGLALTTALAHLHKNALVHRDIKPSNIIYLNGLPKLADIGLVCEFDATLSYVGTIGFVAPEGPGTPQADIYSLGKVLYEAATARDRQEFPELPTQLGGAEEQQAGLLELNEILLKACEGNPRARYQTAEEMHEDLLLLRSGKSLVRLRTAERRFEWAKRIGLAAGVLAALGMAAFLYQKRQTDIVKRFAAENSRLAQEARANAQQSSDRLVKLEVANGVKRLNQGELSKSLLWFSSALSHITNNARSELIHRMRIQSALENQPKLTHLFVHDTRVFRCAFTPDGSTLVTQSDPDRISLYDLKTGQRIFTLEGTNAANRPQGSSYAPAVSFSPDGARFFIRGLKAGVDTEVFDLKERRPVSPKQGGRYNRHILDTTDGRKALIKTGPSSFQFGDLDSGGDSSSEISIPNGRIICGRLSQKNGRAGFLLSPAGPAGSAPIARIEVWDLVTRKPIGPALASDAVGADSRFLLSHEGNELLLVFEGELLGFDMVQGKPMEKPERLRGRVTSLSVSGSDQWVVLGLPRGLRKLERIDTAEEVTLEEGSIRSIGLSGDGLLLSTATDQGRVHVWNRLNGEQFLPTLKHPNWVFDSQFSPDGTALATAGEDRAVRVWDLTPTSPAALTIRQSSVVLAASYSHDGKKLAVANTSSARVWDAQSGRPLTPPLTLFPGPLVGRLLFSPDDKHLLALWRFDSRNPAAGKNRKGIRVWNLDPTNGYPSAHWFHQDLVIRGAAFSPDSKYVATGGDDVKAAIWDVATGELITTLAHESTVNALAFGPRSGEILTSSASGRIRLWDFKKGTVVREFGNTSGTRSLAFAPGSDSLLADGASDQFAHLWNVRSGAEVRPPMWEAGNPVSVLFSPQGSRLLTFGLAPPKLWNLASSSEPPSALTHQSSYRSSTSPMSDVFSSADFSRGGDLAVTAYLDGTARIWDTATGEQVLLPINHADFTSSAWFNPAADQFVTGGQDGSIRIWEPRRWLETAEDIQAFATLLSAESNPETETPVPLEELSALFEKLHKFHPEPFANDPQQLLAWHARLASLCDENHLAAQSLPHLDAVIALAPRVPQLAGLDDYYWQRGNAHAELGHDKAAEADFRRAVELDPDKIVSWTYLIDILAVQGLSNDYSKVLTETFARFSWALTSPSARDLGYQTWLADIATKFPNTTLDYPALLALELPPEDRGPLLYRAGQYPEAIAELDTALQTTARRLDPSLYFFKAMAHYQSGQQSAARTALDQGHAALDSWSRSANDTWAVAWQNELYRYEAETMIAPSTARKPANWRSNRTPAAD